MLRIRQQQEMERELDASQYFRWTTVTIQKNRREIEACWNAVKNLLYSALSLGNQTYKETDISDSQYLLSKYREQIKMWNACLSSSLYSEIATFHTLNKEKKDRYHLRYKYIFGVKWPLHYFLK